MMMGLINMMLRTVSPVFFVGFMLSAAIAEAGTDSAPYGTPGVQYAGSAEVAFTGVETAGSQIRQWTANEMLNALKGSVDTVRNDLGDSAAVAPTIGENQGFTTSDKAALWKITFHGGSDVQSLLHMVDLKPHLAPVYRTASSVWTNPSFKSKPMYDDIKTADLKPHLGATAQVFDASDRVAEFMQAGLEASVTAAPFSADEQSLIATKEAVWRNNAFDWRRDAQPLFQLVDLKPHLAPVASIISW